MIDMHCHILPGLDDGPGTLDEAVEMCRIAADDGITTIVATPHFKPGVYEHPAHVVDSKIGELSAALRQQGISIRILPGADVFVTPELSSHFAMYEYLTINKHQTHFLAEFPADFVPPRWDSYLLSFLTKKRITPILTHPERNPWFLNHRAALYPFVQSGGMLQITAMSLTGHRGIEIRDFAVYLLRHDLVHLIASDAHAREGRVPVLSRALAVARDIIGTDKADALVNGIPGAIVEGNKPVLAEPLPETEPLKRTSWLQKLTAL